jgi:hypothetical protein
VPHRDLLHDTRTSFAPYRLGRAPMLLQCCQMRSNTRKETRKQKKARSTPLESYRRYDRVSRHSRKPIKHTRNENSECSKSMFPAMYKRISMPPAEKHVCRYSSEKETKCSSRYITVKKADRTMESRRPGRDRDCLSRNQHHEPSRSSWPTLWHVPKLS